MPEVTLSPPWYTFANQIKYTYGLSRYIKVNDLIATADSYTLIINVCNDLIATALAAVLPATQDFGGVVVTIVIFNSTGAIVPAPSIDYTPETLADTFCLALYSNPLFIGTVLTDVTTLDYLPDLKISFSTYDQTCVLQQSIYCPTCSTCVCN